MLCAIIVSTIGLTNVWINYLIAGNYHDISISQDFYLILNEPYPAVQTL